MIVAAKKKQTKDKRFDEKHSRYRYGLLRDGAKDIKSHSWFITLDWADVYHRKLNPTFKPKVEFEDDTSNFMYQSEDIFRENSVNEYSDEFSLV